MTDDTPPKWRVVRDDKDGVWDAFPSEALGWPKLKIDADTRELAIAKVRAAMATIVAPYIAAELRRQADSHIGNEPGAWGEGVRSVIEALRTRADELDGRK